MRRSKKKMMRRLTGYSLTGTMLAVTACTTLMMTGCMNDPVSTQPSTGQIVLQNPEENQTSEEIQTPEEARIPKKDNVFEASRGRIRAEFGNQVPEHYEPEGPIFEESNPFHSAAENLRAFAAVSSEKIFPNVSGNYLYSPASLYMALQLCSTMTTPDAAPDLMELLGAANREEVYAQGNALIRNLSVKEPEAIQTFGNSIWVNRKDNKPLGETAESVIRRGAEALGADIYYDDLMDPGVQGQMNSWIKDHTGGLIDEMPQEPNINTAMALYNTLYFDKKWRNTVSDDEIQTAKFYPEGESSPVTIDRIEYSMVNHHFVRTEHATASAVYYRDSSYMILIKPNSDEEFQAVMSEDLGEIISAYVNREFVEMTNTYEVLFGIPMLDYECSTGDLEGVLKAMGVESIFTTGTFSELDDTIYVSDVAQKCRIIVDQNGTKAAAVTEIMEEVKGMPEPIPTVIDLRMDHEYAYVIMSDDNIPLFIGAVKNPKEN